MKAKKGDWVNIYNVVMEVGERAPQVPEDTKSVPLEMWVKGFIQNDACVGDQVEIKTITGRTVSGKLVEINPSYTHSFGNTVPEVFQIGLQLKEILFGGGCHE
ncbi:2-amino-4-oxopentanoate thiolase subunit OrtA [Marinisporobacter balticus]|uniref:2-amino-4-ketopentanoate thiolase alpha subunit n=1 Tax=Marinisporobacter balticus TaxID=2018667 RepID=A0A4V2SCE3_9FIRM|nr:2-amino-4-oxopentanoate thiolase subunit OrtA [Marinisporobacter balticus]TCO79040.1 2-amino-4-ketopentanoate thiolase alpha subunit [Marinisporobacter balticus]